MILLTDEEIQEIEDRYALRNWGGIIAKEQLKKVIDKMENYCEDIECENLQECIGEADAMCWRVIERLKKEIE